MEVFFPSSLCLFKSLHLAFSLCPTCWHKHHIKWFCFPVFQRLVAQTLPGSPALTLLTCLGVLQDRNWKTWSLCSVRQILHVTTNTQYPVPPFNSLWPKYSDEEWQELFPHHRLFVELRNFEELGPWVSCTDAVSVSAFVDFHLF